jgi:hypothetical protein
VHGYIFRWAISRSRAWVRGYTPPRSNNILRNFRQQKPSLYWQHMNLNVVNWNLYIVQYLDQVYKICAPGV